MADTRLGSAFRRLWASNGISNLGDGIGLTAAPLLAAALTREPALVAGLTVAQRLPWFLFSLLSGALVDRLDRRVVVLGANVFRFVVLGALGLLVLGGQASLPLLYIAFFLLGTAETMADNASLALLPAIVPKEGLEAANGRLFATQTVTNEFIGPPLGGALFALLTALPFLINAGTYGLSALLLMALPGIFRAERAAQQKSIMADIGEGLRWFWNHRLLRTLGMMAGVDNFFNTAALSVFVLFAQDILGLDAFGYGLVLTGGAIGGVAGGLLAERITARLGPGLTICLTNLLPGIAYLVIALSNNPYVVGAMFAFISFSAMIGNVILISLRQAIIPDQLLGRVTSAYRLFALGALPTGALFGGFAAQSFGLTAPYFAGALALVVMAFALLPIVNDRTVGAARAAQDSA